MHLLQGGVVSCLLLELVGLAGLWVLIGDVAAHGILQVDLALNLVAPARQAKNSQLTWWKRLHQLLLNTL